MEANFLQEKILGPEEIKELIPHRGKWLLLDKIVEIKEKSIVAIKTFTLEECEGHVGEKPEDWIVPGVLLCEALNQAGLFLVNYYSPLMREKKPLLRHVTDEKFFSPVRPRERVTLEVELVNSQNEVCSFRGMASVGLRKVLRREWIGLAVDELKF